MITLFNHQKKILQENPNNYLFIWEPGCGKTIGALSLVNKNNLSPLIICPKGLVDMWKETLQNLFPTIKYSIYSKETFRRDWKIIPAHNCVVVDEVHYHFGTKSGMMKSLLGYIKKHNPTHRYFLTGTPYRSSPNDAFVCSSLMGKPLNYYSFQSKFFFMMRLGHRLIPRPRDGMEKELAKVFHYFGSPVKLEECVDMPPAIYKKELFSLTKDQIKAIQTLDDQTAISRYTKIHQICGGTLKSDGYSDPQTFESLKKDRLLELVNNISKVIIVCRYNEEMNCLIKELNKAGYYTAFINGSVDNRHELLQSLEHLDRYVLLVNAKCSEGWELKSCSHMIFYSYDWELKNKIQMEGRIRRINNPRPVMYTSLVCEKSIDEEVVRSLDKKMDFHLSTYLESVL